MNAPQRTSLQVTHEAFQDFRVYLSQSELQPPALLCELSIREVCDFIQRSLIQGIVPLPRVVEARLGAEAWTLVQKLGSKLDVEEVLWTVAAARFFDDPLQALQTIERELRVGIGARCECMGESFFLRCNDFFIKRFGLFGTRAKAYLPARAVEDLFLKNYQPSHNSGAEMVSDEEGPAPLGWSLAAVWDHAVRLHEDRLP